MKSRLSAYSSLLNSKTADFFGQIGPNVDDVLVAFSARHCGSGTSPLPTHRLRRCQQRQRSEIRRWQIEIRHQARGHPPPSAAHRGQPRDQRDPAKRLTQDRCADDRGHTRCRGMRGVSSGTHRTVRRTQCRRHRRHHRSQRRLHRSTGARCVLWSALVPGHTTCLGCSCARYNNAGRLRVDAVRAGSRPSVGGFE